MDSPLMFSFVTAIKDGFGDLRLTIPTVLGQTLPNFEWIIVDDASASPLAGEFPALAADPRVKILRNEQGLGQTASLNRGIDEAKGEWIVRMDGDDLCAPDRLARVEEELKAHPSTELLFSDYAVIDAANRAWAQMRMRHPLSPAFFSYLESQNNPICHPTTVFRRRKPGGAIRHFRTDLVNAQDYALWREILAESGPGSFLHLAHPSVSYRIVRDSLSGARAPEQAVEKNAIRSNQTLADGTQTRAPLSEAQKSAMQAYRLLYYRFAGHAAPASAAEDFLLLADVCQLPALLPRAAFFLFFRPLRKFLLTRLFSGIYE